jgi:hypothetical protein
MPLPKGWRNFSLRPEIISKLQENFNAERDKYPKSTKLTTYLNDILDIGLDNKDWLRKYAPFKWIGSQGQIFLLYDNFNHSTIEVEVHGGERVLWCRQDKTDDCDHVGFCWAQGDVYRELQKHGFKPPKAK